jgi:glycosyltransferase involved in cell wall biosynthesis
MKESDILLHPSLIEALGKVIMEGAANGLPAIRFSQYPSPAVLDGITGFQVETFEEVLDLLGLLIKDLSLRLKMGAEAVKYMEQFDWKLIARQWGQVFQEAILLSKG